ncbi:MAG TPA: anti-sigma factor [Gaiellaceae bacterium]|nr:anti-sigma factor [Gaiellaceae bacterium]
MDSIHDLTAAYALDALDADDAATYEAHLGQCEQCRAALAELSDTAASLAWAVDSPAPPARLRESILSQAAAERSNVVPLPQRRSAAYRATAAFAAVAACVAVALGAWGATRGGGNGCSAGWHCSALADGRGLVAVDQTGQGVIVVNELPKAPSGKTYEAWIIPKGGAARPAGLFPGGGGTTLVKLAQTVPRGATIAATVEHAGGTQAPTGTPVFTAQA